MVNQLLHWYATFHTNCSQSYTKELYAPAAGMVVAAVTAAVIGLEIMIMVAVLVALVVAAAAAAAILLILGLVPAASEVVGR